MQRTLLCTTLFALSLPALAVDGVIEINHARALAGGITPGDTPGYPVTLSQSGSYRLTGNLTLPDADATGIVVTVPTVHASVDLNGFSIQGPNSCSVVSGVTCTANGSGVGVDIWGSDIRVRNGVISGTGADAVNARGSGAIIENLVIDNAGGYGISAGGQASIVRGNAIHTVLSDGIRTTNYGMLVDGNVVYGTGGVGINANITTLVSGNSVIGFQQALSCSGSIGYGNNVMTKISGALPTVNANCSGSDLGGNRVF